MVRIDGSALRATTARFAGRLVPLASRAVVAVRGSAPRFLPNLRVFVDEDQESIASAILGDAPSAHWGIGEEAMAPVEERCAFELMDPGLDGGPARW